ncbi:MAG: glycoside hydrolase family 20 zincin-like fold domain-containing protein, partial [Marinilabiliales bacterium]|nr:glycoside hydrolase family 20 zincin-like fold domain-containing protein [Marinilabiliales bacterium]
MTRFNRLTILLLFCAFPWLAAAQRLDFSRTRIYTPDKKNVLLLRAATVLQEELALHTGISPAFAGKPESKDQPLIVVTLESATGKLDPILPGKLAALKPTGEDGFKLVCLGNNQIVIAGHDERGALYGVGYLLRKMSLSDHSILYTPATDLSTTPVYPIRGHQLGYRPKTNAYDAWSVAQYDRYIRDLALFGANSIEIMPPRTDDDPTSVHMKLPAIQMIVEQARICKSYGLDVWMWYPNMNSDYHSADSIRAELAEREHIFSILPKLDALFVPGGDPGDLEPDPLFDWLSKEAEVLKKYHPQAKIWVSPQAFKPGTVWYANFFKHINAKPNWLGGVVYGPWIKMPLPEVRKVTDPSIPIRLYPDITHSYSCQYPVPKWDLAFAMTLGRECINPRPLDEKLIHNRYANLAQGSISYSEGTNDDVNKFIWTGQDWNPETPVTETLRDYARYFIGPDFTEGVTRGLMALEENFRGALLSNEQVEHTLQMWQDMEKMATPSVLANPRFQSGLIRAYYDAYTRRRLVYETSLEQQARNSLENAQSSGIEKAIRDARNKLMEAKEQPVAQELKSRCFALADSLFRSFGAQLTIEKHHAMGGRGNFIDNIDIPLNDALWLLDQLNKIEKSGNDQE